MTGRAAIMSPADRRGLSRPEAAAYIGVSAALFDRLVQRNLMPSPKRIFGRLIWDRQEVDIAFGNLAGVGDEPAPLDAEAAEWAM